MTCSVYSILSFNHTDPESKYEPIFVLTNETKYYSGNDFLQLVKRINYEWKCIKLGQEEAAWAILTDRKHGIEYPDVQRVQKLYVREGFLSEEQGSIS